MVDLVTSVLQGAPDAGYFQIRLDKDLRRPVRHQDETRIR